jgi:hypothetical protein
VRLAEGGDTQQRAEAIACHAFEGN